MENDRNTYREAVSSEVRALMGRSRTSGAKLAKALGMSQAAMSRRLTGELPFDLDDVLGLVRYFDVPLSKLLPEPAEVSNVRTIHTGGDLPERVIPWKRASAGILDADEAVAA